MPDETTPPGDQGGTNDNAGDQGDDQSLGEAGRRALEAERSSRRAAERRLREMEAELNRFRESTMSETEKAIERARREATAEAQNAFNRRIVQAEVRAAAAGRLADPEDAIRFLDLDGLPVKDGEVDKKAIASEIERLVKAKPYLAAGATRPTGDADQGARGTPAGGDMNSLIRGAFRR